MKQSHEANYNVESCVRHVREINMSHDTEQENQ